MQFNSSNFYSSLPDLTIERVGEPKQQTAGATGLLTLENGHLAVVANRDSRIWDFYQLDSINNKQYLLNSFTVSNNWPSYQSINLIQDQQAIYAIAFYKQDNINCADLILISYHKNFELIMDKINTKKFKSENGVDFASAAGLQMGNDRKLHLWNSQSISSKQIAISQFSQK